MKKLIVSDLFVSPSKEEYKVNVLMKVLRRNERLDVKTVCEEFKAMSCEEALVIENNIDMIDKISEEVKEFKVSKEDMVSIFNKAYKEGRCSEVISEECIDNIVNALPRYNNAYELVKRFEEETYTFGNVKYIGDVLSNGDYLFADYSFSKDHSLMCWAVETRNCKDDFADVFAYASALIRLERKYLA